MCICIYAIKMLQIKLFQKEIMLIRYTNVMVACRNHTHTHFHHHRNATNVTRYTFIYWAGRKLFVYSHFCWQHKLKDTTKTENSITKLLASKCTHKKTRITAKMLIESSFCEHIHTCTSVPQEFHTMRCTIVI